MATGSWGLAYCAHLSAHRINEAQIVHDLSSTFCTRGQTCIQGHLITFKGLFHLQINARTRMAWLNEDHISAPINETQMDLYMYVYLQKNTFYFNPSYPNTCNSVKHFFCGTFLSQSGSLPFIQKLEELPSQRGLLGMQKHCFSWHAAVIKEFNRSQNICYGLISFPGRTIQHCKANVRTWVYIGKLKGNQASGFSLNRNKSCFGEFGRKKNKNTWGGGRVCTEKIKSLVNGWLAIMETKEWL